MLSHPQKEAIAQALRDKKEAAEWTQNALAKKIEISSAYLSHIINNKWIMGGIYDPSDDIWTRIELFCQGELSKDWNIAETEDLKRVYNLCNHAKEQCLSKAISFTPGSGKTTSLKHYAVNTKGAYYVGCENYYSKKAFLIKIQEALGIYKGDSDLCEMMEQIIATLNNRTKPLLILDEFDSLSAPAMHYFKSLYNQTNCGFILAGGLHLRKRIDSGASRNVQSMAEIRSRLGGRYYEMNGGTFDTVNAICRINGITDAKFIKETHRSCNGDLRQVHAAIKTYHFTRGKDEK